MNNRATWVAFSILAIGIFLIVSYNNILSGIATTTTIPTTTTTSTTTTSTTTTTTTTTIPTTTTTVEVTPEKDSVTINDNNPISNHYLL